MVIESADAGSDGDVSPPEKVGSGQETVVEYEGLPIELLLGTLAAPGQYGEGCFVCHRTFTEAQQVSVDRTGVDGASAEVAVEPTQEDVIPKWLLKSLGLGNAGAVMPNGQLFRYGQRKVPCCLECNRRMSVALEKPVSAAFKAGPDAVLELDKRTLFMWLAKIYYGTRGSAARTGDSRG